jgi:hypothetical protein
MIAAFRLPAVFLISVVLGSLPPALLLLLHAPSDISLFALVASSFVLSTFGVIPAVALGIPGLHLINRKRATRTNGLIVMTCGGASAGFLITAMTFNGFEAIGSLLGGSTGAALGGLVYPVLIDVRERD